MLNCFLYRNCDPVLYIPSSTEELFHSADIKCLKSKIQSTIKRLEAITLKLSITESDLDEQRINCLDEIDSHHSNLLALLNNIVEKSKTKVVHQYDTMSAELKRHSQDVETSVADLKAAGDQLDVSNGNRAQQFIEYKKCQNIMKATDQISKDANTNVRLKVFGVSIDKRLEELLTNLDTLVSVTETFKVKKTRNVDVSVRADTDTCSIFGTCVLTDGSVLLTDYFNNRLKRLDSSSLSVTDHCLMEEGPTGVCYINDNEVVVAQGRSLVFVALLPRLTPTRTLTLDHCCWYVAHSDNELFVTDSNKSMYVYDISGDLLRTVTTDDYGQNIFSRTHHVAVSDDGEKVFIADFDKGLITVDRHGRVLSTLTHSDVRGTQGVCPDGSGGLFLCGYLSHNVVHVGRGGNVLSEVVSESDGLTCPLSVTYDTMNNRLYVSQHHNNNLLMFELQ